MPAKTPRARVHAALRRSSAFRTAVHPLARSARTLIQGLQRTRSKPAEPPREQAWKIESLEPKLLLSADGMPGVTRIEGSIDQPGEQDVYEFVVAEKTRMFFDGAQGDQIQWQLDKEGASLFSSRDLLSIGDPFLDLMG